LNNGVFYSFVFHKISPHISGERPTPKWLPSMFTCELNDSNWNDAQFIGIVRDRTSRLSTRPSGDVSETCRTSRRSCCQKRDA
jgi:hypothetical protein